ncbi:hypothetical protein ILYODFUR_008870 [Ilyodon furcidens]|uniref:Uncharacterized protein n=1 Tax=Ilyodon furcidens TaxID=33524 RepID=A0ABV0SVC6_9TELE
MVLYAGGVTLHFVTGLGSVPGAERIGAGLVSSTSHYNLLRPRLERRHRVSCKYEDGNVLTFSLTVVGYFSMEQT